jgi:glycosyltransferase involved in cell wall biosynthesis
MDSLNISILLPVYNAAPFLRQCINSILSQTCEDFELIILNDGSTDDSEKIICSFTDSRIIYIKNHVNQGLIFTLNTGIDLARGNYIARMDADDICAADRFETQKKYLDEHPQISIVCSPSIFIDERDQPLPSPESDRKFLSYREIRKRLPFENCITHPSVMGRAAIFKKYKYSIYQKNIEDYDLWLRLTGDGKRIEKVPQPLLYYRIHKSSITSSALKYRNFFLIHFHCKRRYLSKRIWSGKFNDFDLLVSIQMGVDLVRALLKETKKTILRR